MSAVNSSRARAGRVPQAGFVLLLVVLTMIAIGGVVFLARVGKSANSAANSIDPVAVAGVQDLKQALIGYVLSAVAAPSSSYPRPGTLPTPDSLADGVYDGQSDTRCLSNTGTGLPASTNNSATERCLGKWPWRVIPIDLNQASRNSAGAILANDPSGQVPWLAISANLALNDGCLLNLNSDVLNRNYTSFVCNTTSALPHPWLTVLGPSGETLTRRAVAVIILPGAPLTREDGARQTRTSVAAPGNPSDYLDKISLPIGCAGSCTGAHDNAGLTNTFISFPAGLRYPPNAEDSAKSGVVPFNDVVAFLTIDELMPYIERRVLDQMAVAVKDSKMKTGSYPWAASYVMPTNFAAFRSAPDQLTGLFPFFAPSSTGQVQTYPTFFTWNVSRFSSVSARCRQVQASPSRYANVRQNTHTDAQTLAGTATGTGTWRGKSAVVFSGTSPAAFNKTFTLYTNSSCTSTAGSASYPVTRTITFATDITCNATPTQTYVGSGAGTTQTWGWSCGTTLMSASGFGMSITDRLASPIVQTTTRTLLPSGSVSLTGLRYQPEMPDWYFDNGWYRTGFYAQARAAIAGGSPTACPGTTNLMLGTNPVTTAAVFQAGKSLTNISNRPSSSISEYFEGNNLSAWSTCLFDASFFPGTDAANDKSLSVPQ